MDLTYCQSLECGNDAEKTAMFVFVASVNSDCLLDRAHEHCVVPKANQINVALFKFVSFCPMRPCKLGQVPLPSFYWLYGLYK